MRRLELAASLVWGTLLALLLAGAGTDGSTGLLVYAACALVVWLSCFVVALRRNGSHLALTAIPLSLLGPLAVVPVAILRWRKSRRTPTRAEPSKQPRTPSPRPTPAEPAPPPPPPRPVIPPPVTRPRRRKHPNQVLAVMLIGSVLAFPVVGLAVITLAVVGGTTLLTAHDIRNVALVAGFFAGGSVLATAVVWHEGSRESSKTARRVGWLLTATVAVLVGLATSLLTQGKSPSNLSRPTVSGHARVGLLLVGHDGRWTAPGGPLSFDYQWERCNSACIDIDGATNAAYTPTERDLHKRIRLSVAASPTRGVLDFSSSWADSNETAPVTP